MTNGEGFDVRAGANTFRDRGVVTIRDAFTSDALMLADVSRRHVDRRFGVVEQDPSTWGRHCDGAISTRRFRHTERFNKIIATPVRALLDEVFGPGRWEDPPDTARVLVTPPRKADEWRVPTAFHLDVPLDEPSWPCPGVLIFSFLSNTEPGGGGTCVVPGSHRLADDFLAEHQDLPIDRRLNVFLRNQDDWLRQLVNEDDRDAGRTSRCFAGTVIGDVPVRVIELTGRPGDVVVTHQYTLHSGAPNVSPRMRLMVATAIGVR